MTLPLNGQTTRHLFSGFVPSCVLIAPGFFLVLTSFQSSPRIEPAGFGELVVFLLRYEGKVDSAPTTSTPAPQWKLPFVPFPLVASQFDTLLSNHCAQNAFFFPV